MPTIFYRSRPILIVSPPQEALYDAEVESFRIFERTEQERAAHATDQGVMYCVYIEADAETESEAVEVSDRASELIGDLERVWIYAMGEPMRAVRNVLEIYHGPEGWETNFAEAKEALQANCGLTAAVSITSRHWIKTPYWPLRRALTALQAYRAADEITRTLIELHLDALRSTRREGRLFFLAKGLELVRDLLPGRGIDQKERALDPSAKARLTKSLNWLYNMSNNRADTRHIVRPRAARSTLHAPMTPEELRQYERNADIVIRDVASQRLGIECAIIESV